MTPSHRSSAICQYAPLEELTGTGHPGLFNHYSHTRKQGKVNLFKELPNAGLRPPLGRIIGLK
jgi:hypothetical protein